MPEITVFQADDIEEFNSLAELKNYKKGPRGYNVGYDMGNYALVNREVLRTNRNFVSLVPEELNPESPPPAPVGRGRARAPTVSTRHKAYSFRDSDVSFKDSYKTAHVYTDYNIVPRRFTIQDLTSENNALNRIKQLIGASNRPVYDSYGEVDPDPSDRNQNKFNKLLRCDTIIVFNAYIEGAEYNKDAKTPYKINKFRGKTIVEVSPKVFITSSVDRGTFVSEWLKSQPVEKEVFVQAMRHHLMKKVVVSIREKEQEYARLQQQMLELQKSIGEVRFVEKAIKSASDTNFTNLTERLLALPTVQSIKYYRSGFKLLTNDLYVEPEEDKRFYVGQYEIILRVGESFAAKFRNIAAPRGQRGTYVSQHPHGGCQGSHFTAMSSALKNLDYFTFVLAAIERLQSVNPHEISARTLVTWGYPDSRPKKPNIKEYKDYMPLLREVKGDHDDDYTDGDAEEEEDEYDDEEEEGNSDLINDSSEDDYADDDDDDDDDGDDMEDEDDYEEEDEEDDRPVKRAKK